MVAALLKISDRRTLEIKYTALRAEALEKDLDCGLLYGLAQSDRIGVMLKYIQHGAGITYEEAAAAYDEYVDNGGSLEKLSDVVVEALRNGGFISKAAQEKGKKLKNQLDRLNVPQS